MIPKKNQHIHLFPVTEINFVNCQCSEEEEEEGGECPPGGGESLPQHDRHHVHHLQRVSRRKQSNRPMIESWSNEKINLSNFVQYKSLKRRILLL